jgi:V/A-type H+-transporting ATPase subunit K
MILNTKKIIEFFSNPRKAILSFILFNVIIVLVSLLVLQPSLASAQEATPETGLKFMAAAVAVAGSGIGAGIAVSGAASGGAAAIAERPGVATWILILAGLGEGIAIYGLIISILVLGA